MRILITGMAGFIGFSCARELAADGHDILGIDNVNDYYMTALKEARLQELGESVAFRKTELGNRDDVEAVFAEFKPEVVIHLAAQAGVRYSLTNPYAYIDANIMGTMNILECCRHANPKPRLVYASSSSVYGGNTELPFSEKQTVDNPVSLYAATKKSNELMAHTYTHLFGLQTIGLRFFTVYGPWGRPDMALWLFSDAILAGRPIKVFNFGKMQRDFTYIDDIVQGVKACALQPDMPQYEVLNLGNCNSEELMHLIEILEDALGKKAEKVMMPMQDGDVPATYADISRARELLGFEPRTKIEQGVPRFVEWFKAHPEFHTP